MSSTNKSTKSFTSSMNNQSDTLIMPNCSVKITEMDSMCSSV